MAFENIYYAISRKLVVRFKNCFNQHIQRPWFQDNFFINVRKLIFIKKFSAEWSSYLYGVFLLYWSNVLTERFSVLYKNQTKEDTSF